MIKVKVIVCIHVWSFDLPFVKCGCFAPPPPPNQLFQICVQCAFSFVVITCDGFCQILLSVFVGIDEGIRTM